ncbi:MAG: extracellular solute-binding protein [Clostridiales bacterium]|nr:extracellular solute-binding protein [Clostridiales bacterium]
MKFTKLLTWILAMVLLLSNIAHPAFAEEEPQLFSIVAVTDNTIWVHTSIGLIPFDKEGSPIGEALYPGADFYAIGPNGYIYYVQDGVIFEMDALGNEIQKWKPPIEQITKILVNETYILLMAGETAATLNLNTGNFVWSSIAGLTDIAVYNKEHFIVCAEVAGCTLSLLKYTTLEEVEYISTGGIYHGICLSAEDSGIYCYNNNNIFGAEKMNRSAAFKTYATFKKEGTVESVMMDDENIYAITHSVNGWKLNIHPLEYAKLENRKTLSIAMPTAMADDRIQKAIDIFTQRHPEYTVAFTGTRKAEKVKTAIMSAEEGYDILYLESLSSADFKSSDMLLDLSDNEVISENLSHYIEMPFLWESDGSLFGLPFIVQPWTLRASKAQLDEFGIEIPDSWTWNDFFALAPAAKENGCDLISTDIDWDALLWQYEGMYCDFYKGTGNYDTDAFNSLVRGWKNLKDEGILYLNSPPFEHNPNGIFEFYSVTYGEDIDTIFPMPLLDGQAATPIFLAGLYVNRFSQNVEMAVEFLEIYSSFDVQLEAGNLNEPILDTDITNYPVLQRLQSLGMTDLVNAAANAPMEFTLLWRELLRTGVVYERNLDFTQSIIELNQDLFADKISLEEYFAEVNERADLMYGE